MAEILSDWPLQKYLSPYIYYYIIYYVLQHFDEPGPGLNICGILVANATMFSHSYRDSHVVANICYSHKFMALLI